MLLISYLLQPATYPVNLFTLLIVSPSYAVLDVCPLPQLLQPCAWRYHTLSYCLCQYRQDLQVAGTALYQLPVISYCVYHGLILTAMPLIDIYIFMGLVPAISLVAVHWCHT